MKPTIGRIVLYHPNQQEEADCGGKCAESFPAIVWAVKYSGCVDLAVFGMWGHTEYALNIPEQSPAHPLGCWSWPQKEK